MGYVTTNIKLSIIKSELGGDYQLEALEEDVSNRYEVAFGRLLDPCFNNMMNKNLWGSMDAWA